MTKGKTTRRRVIWAALPAERQDYWQAFLRTLPKRIVSAFRRGIVLFEMKPHREARGWARTLAREFTPPGPDRRGGERQALAPGRGRQHGTRRHPRATT